MGNVNASEDAKRYRDGYPGEPDDPKQNKNLLFYKNELPSRPEGDFIDNIHKNWFGKYGLLEAHHGYIQWLFPIREDGLNHHAQRLQLHEAQSIANDPVLQNRIVLSYEVMLDFYGMKLLDKTTGKIGRNDNWKQRYDHLNHSFHNYLRITRILKCLGEVGLEHYKMHFVRHVLQEVFDNKQLLNCYESAAKYWAPVLRNDKERQEMMDYIKENEHKVQTRRYGRWNDSDDEDDFRSRMKKKEESRNDNNNMKATPMDIDRMNVKKTEEKASDKEPKEEKKLKEDDKEDKMNVKEDKKESEKDKEDKTAGEKDNH